MITTIFEDKHYTFIVPSDWPHYLTFDENQELLLKNDIYAKYKTTLAVKGDVIICSKVGKKTKNKVYKKETYEEYKEYIANHNFEERERWIYNILDGISEQERVLYQDEEILVIPNYKWSGDEIRKLQILTIAKDRSIRSIRDLNGSHIELLKKCRDKTHEIIKTKYGIDENVLKVFLHYAPSAYQLHIHFVLITNTEYNSSVEYSHELSSVIFNLEIKSDYYQTIIMNKSA